MKKGFVITLVLGMMLTSSVLAAGKFSLSGDDLSFDMENNIGIAKGHVVLEQDGAVAKSDYAQFNNKERTGYMKGNVVADRDGYHLTAGTMTVHDDNHMSASENVVLVRDGRTVKAALLDYYKREQKAVATNGPALLIDTDGSTVEADSISHSRISGLVTATGNVKIKSPVRKLTASADQAIYRTTGTENGNYLELTGNAVATQDGNTVRGNKLKLNNARVASAEGRVSIDFFPTEKAGEVKKS